MSEKKVNVNVCTGSTCYAQGRAILTELQKIIPNKYSDNNVKVLGVPCLEVCSIDWGHEKAPYVKVNNEIIQTATVEKVLAEVEKQLTPQD